MALLPNGLEDCGCGRKEGCAIVQFLEASKVVYLIFTGVMPMGDHDKNDDGDSDGSGGTTEPQDSHPEDDDEDE